jgi:hypothetical protein
MVIGDDRWNDGTGLGVGCRVWGDANVIQELSRGGAGALKIPRLVKLCMMAVLDDAGVEIKVDDVVVRGRVDKEYALEVVTIQFPMPNARFFNADAGAEKLQVVDVGFMSVESLKWSLLGDGVDKPVVEVDRVLQCRGPVLGGEASTTEKGPCANSKLVVVYLDGTILGGAIGASRFHNIMILPEQEVG